MPFVEQLEALHLNGDPKPSQSTATSILSQLTRLEKVFLLSGTSFTRTSGLPKHSLHPVKTSDGPTDVRGDTVFNAPPSIVVPNATCLASTWDLELIRRVGGLLAHEAKLKTTDILLAPTLNLHRDVRGGRNQESYGEDPFLAGKCGAAFSNGIAVCPKHLVCNDSETKRRFYDVQVDERTLREIYMRPFEIVVREANPQVIMTSYNKINGTSAAQNAHTMGIVREEWGYDGLFMSDWFGTYDGPASVKAGLDLEMPFPAARGPRLLEAISKGTLSEAELDGPSLRMIRFLQDLKAPADTIRGADQPSIKLPDQVACNRQAAADGIVLLANPDSLLPLDPTATSSIAVIGSLATDRVLTQLICPSYLVTPLEGVRHATDAGRIRHAHGLQTHKVVPKLDKRYTGAIEFRKWNIGDRQLGSKSPVCVDTYTEALEAMLLRHIEGLEAEFEIEMVANVRVTRPGSHMLSVISASDAEVFINGRSVFQYTPGGLVDIQRFLFHSHEIAKTFKHSFETGRTYDVRVVAKSQPQSGPEPVAQGLIFGMVEDITREESLAEAVGVARTADTAVVFVGNTAEWEMEGVDRADMVLPCGQDELVRAVMAVNPRTIVVNQSGSAVDLASAQGAAILHAHFSGQESGNAIADVLFGKVNPSGKTSYTWPKRLEDSPSFGNFPCASDLSVKYSEGLQMGYKGYQASRRAPAYPFGYGLSYTSFAYSDVTVEGDLADEEFISVSLSVTNTGPVTGRAIVQVYVSAEAGRRLEAFAKTSLLKPGAGETVVMTLDRRSFARWDTDSSDWSVSSGTFAIEVARSCEDIIQTLHVSVAEALHWQGL